MILEFERRLMFYFWGWALRFVRELLIVNFQILRL